MFRVLCCTSLALGIATTQPLAGGAYGETLNPTRFGVHAQSTVIGGGPYPGTAPLIRATLGDGAVVRDWWSWPLIQAGGPEKFDWSKSDTAVNAAKANGQVLIVCLFGTPPWANGGKDQTWPADNVGHWRRFVAATVERYKNSKVVVAWEIWNEENTPTFFQKGSSESWKNRANEYYFKVLEPAYNAIKSVDSNAKVALGGIAPAWDGRNELAVLGFLNQVLSNAGASQHLDYIAYHPYLQDPRNIAKAIDQVRAVTRRYSDTDKPVIVTEWSPPTRRRDEKKQSNIFVQQAATLQAKNVLFACLHYVIDVEGAQVGLFQPNGARFRLANTYSQYLQVIGKSTFDGEPEWINKNVATVGYTFKNQNRYVSVIWNNLAPDNISLQLHSGTLRAYTIEEIGIRKDIDLQTSQNSRRVVTLPVSESPTYLIEEIR